MIDEFLKIAVRGFVATLATTTSAISVVAVLMCGFAPYTPAEPVFDNDEDANSRFIVDFQQFLVSDIAPHTPGYAVVVVLNGDIALRGGFGVTAVDDSQPVDSDTVFRLASLSKSFAAAAVGVLVQRGEVDWDTKIAPLLPELELKIPDYAAQLTLRHLLSHSSGLMPHAYTNLVEHRTSYSDILKLMNKVDFICAPGDCYGYQNVVYSLSGDVVAKVSGESYEAFATENLFHALNMKSASYGLESLLNNPNHASPHVWARQHWNTVRVKNNYYKVAPAAGVNASINDMGQWLLAQLGHYPEVLSPAILTDMHSKIIKTSRSQAHYGQWEDFRSVHYGLGWRVFDYDKQPNFVHHGGWVQGMRSEMIFNPDLQMGMVFLTNSESSQAGDVVPTFLRLYSQYFLVDY